MAKYLNPEMEIVEIDTADVVLTSTGSGNVDENGDYVGDKDEF